MRQRVFFRVMAGVQNNQAGEFGGAGVRIERSAE